MANRISVGKIASFAFLLIFVIIIIVPFFYLFSASLMGNAQYFKKPMEWIPSPALWHNYKEVFIGSRFYIYIWNSIFLAFFTVLFAVFSSSVIAYGFARFRFPFRDQMLVLVIATMMLPGQITMIPTFILYKELGWLGTYLPLLLPQLFGSAFIIFLLRQFFVSLPKEIDEAAMIDGCSTMRIWWHVILPQAKPAMIVSGLFIFMFSWKDVFGPLIYLNDRDLYTLAVGLLYFTSPFYNDYTLQYVGIVIALIPTIIIFVLAQKYLDKGINIANLK